MKLPKTDSISELAEFWDTHDITDFADQVEEVPGPVFVRRRTGGVTVPLSDTERDAIRRMAEGRGLDEAALIHEWVQEKLHQ
jgi:hypothetical protein